MKIYLRYIFFSFCLLSLSTYAASDPMSHELIKERVKPVGQVNTASPAAEVKAAETKPASTGNIGKTTYDNKCVICHGTGVAGAPKLHDEAAWKPRLAQGMNVLLTHVKQGYKAMPPKGTCTDCSDSDLEAAIKYMSKKS
jgi:cytochrome c5